MIETTIREIATEAVNTWPKDTLNRIIVILELVGIAWMIVSCRQAFKEMNRSLYNWKKPGAKKRRAGLTMTVKRMGRK